MVNTLHPSRLPPISFEHPYSNYEAPEKTVIAAFLLVSSPTSTPKSSCSHITGRDVGPCTEGNPKLHTGRVQDQLVPALIFVVLSEVFRHGIRRPPQTRAVFALRNARTRRTEILRQRPPALKLMPLGAKGWSRKAAGLRNPKHEQGDQRLTPLGYTAPQKASRLRTPAKCTGCRKHMRSTRRQCG